MFFERSDWLLKLGVASAIHLPALFWNSCRSVSSFLGKKRTIWCWLSTILLYTKTIIHHSVGEDNRYLPLHFAARQISTTFYTSTSVNNCYVVQHIHCLNLVPYKNVNQKRVENTAPLRYCPVLG